MHQVSDWLAFGVLEALKKGCSSKRLPLRITLDDIKNEITKGFIKVLILLVANTLSCLGGML